MKRLIVILLAFALLMSLPIPALAAAREYVHDHNGNLTDAEVARLNELAAEIRVQYGFDILIDMDNSVTESAKSYAERRYAEVGGSENGILLAITADKWYIHLVGEAEDVISETYVDFMWEKYNEEETYFDGVAVYFLAAQVVLKQIYGEGNAVEDHPAIPATRQKSRLVDDAGLLTAQEADELLAALDEISERQECDVAVVTVKSLGNKTVEAYADDYYDYNGYGMGDGDDGILLLISMGDRDWAISTYGFAIPAFTDAGQAYMVGKIKSDLSDGNYSAAFTLFAGLCDDFLTQAKTGEPYDKGHLPNTVGFVPYFFGAFLFFLPLGFVIAMLVTRSMKKKMKTVEMQRTASSYVRNGSIRITGSRDDFLYRNVSKTAKPSERDSDGGSSTHTSSSGRSHGGSSGKF